MTPVWDIRFHLSLQRATLPLRLSGSSAPRCQHSHQPPTETTLRKEEPQELVLALCSSLLIMSTQPVFFTSEEKGWPCSPSPALLVSLKCAIPRCNGDVIIAATFKASVGNDCRNLMSACSF